jgi:shikimate dehydrogenase
MGAAMHRAGYAALSLDWTYVPFAVTREKLPAALAGMRALAIRGFGVSMPFKLDVMPLLDRIDPIASKIGAVNTIVNDDGTLTGFNTDAFGAATALEEAVRVAGARVLLIGGGGAARAVAYGLAERGATLHIVNRTVSKAEEIAKGVGATWGPLDDVRRSREFDAIVNASSAGMVEYGAASPVPAECIETKHVVMDIVYKPIRTELLTLASQRGARTVHGGRMLLHQARRQFELYTQQTAPLDAMDRALRAQVGG